MAENNKRIVWESYALPTPDEKDSREDFLDEMGSVELDEEETEIYNEIKHMPVVMDTHLGPMIINDSMNTLARTEHRVAHTNFTITKKIAVITNFIEGVETLAVISRYQMIVGFGRLFDASEVRRNIENMLINIDDYPEDLYQQQLEIIELEAL